MLGPFDNMVKEISDFSLVIDIMAPADRADIQRIADARLGPGYLPLSALLNKEQVTFSAWMGRRVVGFLCASLWTLQDFRKHVPLLASLPEIQTLLTNPIGMLHVTAVDKSYEKQGIGTALIAHAIDTLFSHDRPLTVTTTAWSDNQGVHVGGPLHCNGFRKIGYLADYWREDSLARGYECPTCGKPPCHCTASIFVRTLT